ncbi:hypothetical protein ACJX0J_018287, partial [Zea mays]
DEIILGILKNMRGGKIYYITFYLGFSPTYEKNQVTTFYLVTLTIHYFIIFLGLCDKGLKICINDRIYCMGDYSNPTVFLAYSIEISKTSLLWRTRLLHTPQLSIEGGGGGGWGLNT